MLTYGLSSITPVTIVPNPRQRASDQYKSINQSDNTAENLLSVLSDGVIGVDFQGNVCFINKVACKLTGWEQKQAVGQPLSAVFTLKGETTQQLTRTMLQDIITSGRLLGPITRQRLQQKQGSEILVDFSISPLDDNTAILMFHYPQQSEDHSKSRTLLYQVSYDALTHIANREALQQTLTHLHEDFKIANGTYSLLLLDLDRFKLINDSYGHKIGDKLLQQVATRMQHFIRDKDNLGRWGGEEFLIILPNTEFKIAYEVAERIRCGIANQSYVLDGREVFVTASIGIANYPNDGDNPEELLRIADATLYEAKRSGRNRVHTSKQLSNSIFSIGTQLEKALQEDRVIPVYQPIFDLTSGEEVAEEALARIRSNDGRLIEANRFIDAAVQLQLVHRIDYQIIKTTISRCVNMVMNENKMLPHFVNVSADLLRHPDLVQEILGFAYANCTACGSMLPEEKPLVIEITEQEFLSDVDEVRRILAPFIEFGLRLAIDDFGSGYSSLQYLADLPISFLKLEGELVKRVAREPRVRKIIQGVQNMAESLDLITIAEHIEDQATLDVLTEIGVNWGQGNFSAQPRERR